MMQHLPHPVAIERQYAREIDRRSAQVHRVTMEAIQRELDDVIRLDSAEEDANIIVRTLRRLRRTIESVVPLSSIRFQKHATDIDRFTTRNSHRLIRSAVESADGPTLVRIPAGNLVPGNLLSDWVKDNTALIRSVDERYFADMERVTLQEFIAGTNREDLARVYQRRFEVSLSRGRLIADDQTGKLNGRINRYRQMEAGIEQYIWSDSGDSHVRPGHVARNGMTFFWNQHPSMVDGNPDGHPGEPIRCRCSGIPVV